MKMVQPNDFKLTRTDDDYKNLLLKVYSITHNKQKEEALALIENIEQGKWRNQLLEIYKDCKRLFDPFNDFEKIMNKVAKQRQFNLAEMLETIANETNNETKDRILAATAAAKIYGEIAQKTAAISTKSLKSGDLNGAVQLPPPKSSIIKLNIHPAYADKD
jgi:hypothetical protein